MNELEALLKAGEEGIAEIVNAWVDAAMLAITGIYLQQERTENERA